MLVKLADFGVSGQVIISSGRDVCIIDLTDGMCAQLYILFLP